MNSLIIKLYICLVLQCVMGVNKTKESECLCKIPSLQWKPRPFNTRDSTSTCDIRNVLEKFSLQIKPPNNFYLKGKHIAKKIFKILQSSHYDLDRYLIAGSAGKGTAINNGSDFDVIVFINNIEPPYLHVIQELKHTINKFSGQLENYKYRSTTEMLIKIKVSNFKFDIMPTANYKNSNSSQFEENSQRVKKIANPFVHYYRYNGGFSEEAAAFGKKQSAFVHSVVRLAKYWNAKLYLPEYFHGRSFRMELIAIKACEGVPENNVYLAFKRFLNMLADFEHLNIIFEDYYKISEIPPFLLQYRGPIILDPVSYYSNLAHHWNIPKTAILRYKINAKISLGELEKWEVSPCANTQYFDNIFNKDYSSDYHINLDSVCSPSEYYTID